MAEPSHPIDLVSCFRQGNAFTGTVILTTSACCAGQDLTDQITVTEEAPRQLRDHHDGHEPDQRKGQSNLPREEEKQDHPILDTEEIAQWIVLYRNDEIIEIFMDLYSVCWFPKMSDRFLRGVYVNMGSLFNPL